MMGMPEKFCFCVKYFTWAGAESSKQQEELLVPINKTIFPYSFETR